MFLPTPPDEHAARYTLADDLHEAGFAAGAASVLTPLLRARPHHVAGRILRGIALADAGDIEAAIDELRVAVRVAPDEAVAWTNLGMLLKVAGAFDEAVAAADRAVGLRPDLPQIRLNRVVTLLRAGRFTEAWPDFEIRRSLCGVAPAALPSLASLAGRTVRLTHEAGFGDTIQFLRYAPMLDALGARVQVAVPDPLAALARRVVGVADVVAMDQPSADMAADIPFPSLPGLFATTLATIPAAIPYVTADASRVAVWRARLPPTDLLRVGLAWAGQARPWLPGFSVVDRRRSMQLTDLGPLAKVPGVTFVSLQKGDAQAQARSPPAGMALRDPMNDVADFAETAAIIANLDVVVSVDTSVAHLAGAMGIPVLMLDRYDSCWRWLAGRHDSPWYPTLRIIRQARLGDWAPVAERAVRLLAAMERGGVCPISDA